MQIFFRKGPPGSPPLACRQLPAKPGSSVSPYVVGSSLRYAEGLGGFPHGQTGKVSQLDEVGRDLVDGSQIVEHVVNVEHLLRWIGQG